MTMLVLQMEVSLRRLEPEGLDTVRSTYVQYDLPASAAGGFRDWVEQMQVQHRVEAHWTEALNVLIPDLLNACQWEQPELPFG